MDGDRLFDGMPQNLAALQQHLDAVYHADPVAYQRMLGFGGWIDNGEPVNGWVAPRELWGNAIAPINVARVGRQDVGGIVNAQNHVDINAEEEEEQDHNRRHEQDRVEEELRRTIARLERENKEQKDNIREKERWLREDADHLRTAQRAAEEYLRDLATARTDHHEEVMNVNTEKQEEIAEIRKTHAEEIRRLKKEKEDQKRDYENQIQILRKKINAKETKMEDKRPNLVRQMEREKNDDVAGPSPPKQARVQKNP